MDPEVEKQRKQEYEEKRNTRAEVILNITIIRLMDQYKSIICQNLALSYDHTFQMYKIKHQTAKIMI